VPLRGDVQLPETTDDQPVLFSPPRSQQMRPYPFIFRACVVVSLVLSSSFMAGWKWDFFRH
jgi:hypothetical protein